MRLSRSKLNELAADCEKSAARSARAAASAERDAADPALSPATRREAAAQAPISRRRAAEYREEAAGLRDGWQPENL
ncbi:hypothetical protein [Streptomyces sp. WMMB303]|uniref:hypothetical protein n=1 Tax=Streptomyces sp. WMMB303 TaxID=3034154 RepID=UPI0023EB4CD5|nr:hypothetical protein [Streptomyces sp. WMMB303]MDF4254642.1 hypothetical protein [Streptomyces sp. WMMB303]